MNAKKLYEQYMITKMVAGFEPIEVERASNCTIFGADGREYLDCFSGISVTNAGHGHPKIISAAMEQMGSLVHCCTYVYYNPRAAELAEMLAEISPKNLVKSFFANSGAEAIEGAMRLAKQFTKKKELLCLGHSFHGRTVGTLSITGNRERKKGSGPYLPGVAFAPAPYCFRCPLMLSYPSCEIACAHYLSNVLRDQTAGDVAAFIAEPVLGEGGIIVPPPEYFKIAVEIARNDGALFIVDEVQTGFGRTGKMFGIDNYGVDPDIMCTAKGIASGFPLSAFTVREDIAEAFEPGDHLSTFGGNPICCAAAMANIEVLREERLVENAEARGMQIRGRLNGVEESCPIIGEIRGKGLMIGIELVKDRESKEPASETGKAVRRLCRERGVLVGLGGSFANTIRLQPPLTLTSDQADNAVDVLIDVLLEVI